MEVGEEGEYTYRYIVTSRMTCIKIGSDESHFNVSVVVKNKVTRPCPQTTTFLKRKESRSSIEPRSFRLPAYPALPLGQTGSQCFSAEVILVVSKHGA